MVSLLPKNLSITEGGLFSQYDPVHRPGSTVSASLSVLCESNCLIGDFQVHFLNLLSL